VSAAAAQENPIDGRAEAIAKAVLGLIPVGKIAGRPSAFRYRCVFSPTHSDYLTRSTRGRWYRICGQDAESGRANLDPDAGFGWREITDPSTVEILDEALRLKLGTLPDEEPQPEVAVPTPAPVKHAARQVETTSPRLSRDPRLPKAGTVLTKLVGDKEHQVTVHSAGFEYDGRIYGSLSKIAKEITGKVWNGFAFFGLGGRVGR